MAKHLIDTDLYIDPSQSGTTLSLIRELYDKDAPGSEGLLCKFYKPAIQRKSSLAPLISPNPVHQISQRGGGV